MLFLCNRPAYIIQSFSGMCLLQLKITKKVTNLILCALQIIKGVCIKIRFIKLNKSQKVLLLHCMCIDSAYSKLWAEVSKTKSYLSIFLVPVCLCS